MRGYAVAEQHHTKRWQRVLWLVAAWTIGGPFLLMAWYLFGPWSLVLVAMMVWTTFDYLRGGDMFGAADPIGRLGEWLPGAWKKDRR